MIMENGREVMEECHVVTEDGRKLKVSELEKDLGLLRKDARVKGRFTAVFRGPCVVFLAYFSYIFYTGDSRFYIAISGVAVCFLVFHLLALIDEILSLREMHGFIMEIDSLILQIKGLILMKKDLPRGASSECM